MSIDARFRGLPIAFVAVSVLSLGTSYPQRLLANDLLVEDIVVTDDLGTDDDTVDIVALLEAIANASATQPDLNLGQILPAAYSEAARSNASAVALFGNEGADTITIFDTVSADADASTSAGEISASLVLDITVDSAWNGGSFADASARAVSGGDGDDTLTSNATIDATADSTSNAGSYSLTGAGVSATVLTTESNATSVGIASGDGTNEVTNSGVINSVATSNANSANVSIVGAGAAASLDTTWDGGTTANATSSGIEGGAGDDTLSTQNQLSTQSSAWTSSTGVAVTVTGISATEVGSTADANATGIDGGAGADTITVGGLLESDAHATAVGVEVSASGQGLVMAAGSRWSSGTTADATSVGVYGGEGGDSITNDGTVDSDADVFVNAETVTVVASSDNGAEDVSKLTSNSQTDVSANGIATVRGIDGGDGGDTITNKSIVDADARSIVSVVEAQLSFEGASSDLLDKVLGLLVGQGGATSTSLAEGIVGGAGSDTITQSAGETNATAISRLPSLGLSLSATNSPSVNLESTVESQAIGINSGTDDDTVTTNGSILADSTSSATAIGIGLSTSGMEGGVSTDLTLSSASTGIDTGGGGDTVTNSATITSNATSPGQTAALVVALSDSEEPAGRLNRDKTSATSKVVASASASGIVTDGTEEPKTIELGLVNSDDSGGINVQRITVEDTDAGQDTVTNTGQIELDAFAETYSASVSVNTVRKAASASAADAGATIVGIRTGSDDDTIDNSGAINGTAEAIAVGVNGSVSAGKGKAKATSKGTDARAAATGIDADGTLSEMQLFQIEASEDESSVTIGRTREAASGDDTVTNTDTVDILARSNAVGVGIGFSAQGSSATRSDSSAESTATTVDGGLGADSVTNAGQLNSRAVATSVAVAATLSADAGLATATSGSNSADAMAVGIDGDGAYSMREELITISTSAVTAEGGNVDLDILNSSSSISYTDRVTRAGGNDVIVNGVVDDNDPAIVYGGIEVSSVATNVTVQAAGVVSKGVGAVVAESDAAAETTGIRGGDGDDDITNRALVDADAASTAAAVGVAVTATGGSVATNKLMEGGTTATASSYGIQADGDLVEEWVLGIEGSINGSIGTISSTVSLAESTTAASGVDVVANSGEVHSNAVATAPQVTVGIITVQGVAGAVSTSTAVADAAGIQAGGNADTVTNTGLVDSRSVATAVATNVTVDSVGVGLSSNALTDGGVVADATSVGIDLDGGSGISTRTEQLSLTLDEVSVTRERAYESDDGDDFVDNRGDVTVRATSVAPAVTGSIVGTGGVALGASTAEANASATALDGGGGNDTLINSGTLDVIATGNADSLNVSYTNAGVVVAADAVWSGGATSNATAYGIDADGGYQSFSETKTYTVGLDGASISHEIDEVFASGDDDVTNSGDIDVTSRAISPSVGVGIVPAGGAVAVTAATSNSDAAAIDTGSGSDTVTNSSKLGVISTSNADAVSVTFVATGGVAASGNAVWDGGVTSTATGSGIRTTGDASRNRTTDISVFTGGEFLQQDDVVTTGSGDNTITNHGAIDVNSTSVSAAVSGGISVAGLGAALSTSTANSRATGLESGDGLDTVTNTNLVDIQATSVAATLNISGTGAGVALSGDAFWDGGTTADAEAAAIRTAAGDDTVHNAVAVDVDGNVVHTGELIADSASVSASASGTVVVSGGLAASITTSKAESRSFGIDTGAGIDTITNDGSVDASAVATADTLNVDVAVYGVAATGTDTWNGGVTSKAFATGIDAGDAGDTVTNNGSVDTFGAAVSVDANLPFVFGGVAGAVARSTANSDVDGIDGGLGADTITNHGVLDTEARSTAVAASGTISVFGVGASTDSAWDGGTTADAKADSIAGGGGNDSITNTTAVTTTTRSRANSDQVAVSVIGVTSAISTSTATTEATSLAGEGGEDTIVNTGSLLTSTVAHATSVGVGVTGIGATGSIDSEWDGGTGSDAKAYGISGGADNDTIDNRARVEARAESDADSVEVAATGALIAVAAASSTAESTATALDGGTGADTITNVGELVVNSDADAMATAVSVTLTSGFTGSVPAMDNQTMAEAKATGIDGGAQSDTIVTIVDDEAMVASTIDVTANATTRDNNVAFTGAIGFSEGKADAKATATAIGVDGGDGSDIVDLAGTIDVSSTGDALAREFSWAPVGAAVASAKTESVATAIGVDGGAGNDAIRNAATITVDSTGTTDGRARGIAGVGAELGGVDSSAATANATGITLGEGGTEIIDPAFDEPFSVLGNTGVITVTATSDANAGSFGLAAVGYSATRANTTAESNSFGLQGGDGVDLVVNGGVVSNTSVATTHASDLSITIGGVAVGDSAMNATANATGVDLQADHDALENAGQLTAISTATSIVDGGNSIAILGGGLDDSFAAIAATATGVDAGDGDDTVTNLIDATVSASTTADAQTSGSHTVNVAGAAANDLTMDPRATSTGLWTGAGSDTITNDGAIDVRAQSKSNANGNGVTITGFGSAVIGSTVTATATGIDSGDDNDVISNNGTIEVGVTDDENSAGEWMAFLDVDGSTFAGAGAASSSSRADSTTTSTGIVAGAGDDVVDNFGSLDVYANALNDTSGSTINIFGSARSTDSAGAGTTATAMAGGEGADTLRNLGSTLVSARTRLELDGASYTLGGVAGATGNLTARTTVRGLVGDAGADAIENSGTIVVRGRSESDTTGDSNTTFGGSSTGAIFGATTSAIGIEGGAGGDTIRNTGPGASIDVDAVVDVDASSTSYTFAGDPGTNTVLTGTASATGIGGGDGSDLVESDGNVSVDADASLLATDGATATFGGGPQSVGSATTTTHAVGISGGLGDDIMVATGNLSVVSRSTAASQNTSNAGAAVISASRAEADADATATATGFDGAEGLNSISNSGETFVLARSSAQAVAYANGASVSITGTAHAITDSTSVAVATGVTAGHDATTFMNDGQLTVEANANTTQPIVTIQEILSIDPNADPNTVEPTEAPDFEGETLPPAGDGTDYPTGTVVFWTDGADTDGNVPVNDPLVSAAGSYYEVVQINTPDGNGGTVTTWQWELRELHSFDRRFEREGQPTEASARGHGASGNGIGNATGVTTATAVGVQFGDGDDAVMNDGVISVTANANAEVTGAATGSGVDGDATATASATATADATGIDLGGGDNVFVNAGDLDVTAIADTSAEVRVVASQGACVTILFWTFCIEPGEISTSLTNDRFANAIGVTTGNGNNTIINDGNIIVAARANDAGGSNRFGISVAGVVTGAGDDTVINNGTISATIQDLAGTAIGTGIGIDTGDGHDTVQLGDGSLVVGSITLGSGDDTLVLEGVPITTDHLGNGTSPDAGGGYDSLVLVGAGTYLNNLMSFEAATKTDEGGYFLAGLAPVEQLTIDGGSLWLGSDYQFSPTGHYSTFIDDEGVTGELFVDGTAVLDGSISVERRGEDYIADGTHFTLVEATGGVLNAFEDVTLPGELPLLNFDLETAGGSLGVAASAAPFATVASGQMQTDVAKILDRIAADSTGEMRTQLGRIQSLRSKFDQAFAGLAPDSHLATLTNTVTITQETTQLVRRHLSEARAVRRGDRAAAAAYQPVTLASNRYGMTASSPPPGAIGSTTVDAAPTHSGAQTWMMMYGGTGSIETVNGHTAVDHSLGGFSAGADFGSSDSVFFGASIGYSEVEMDFDRKLTSANADSWNGTLYLSAFNDDSYFEGGIYYGRQDFESIRSGTIGYDSFTATSNHDGENTMVFAGGGFQIPFDQWYLEPFGMLYYLHVREDGFAESGGGALDQVVAPRSANLLLGELGLTFNFARETREGHLDWSLSVSYNRDFRIDNTAIRYSFEGDTTSTFRFDDRELSSSGIAFGGGLAYTQGRSTLSLDYRGQANRDMRQHIVGARFSYAFR